MQREQLKEELVNMQLRIEEHAEQMQKKMTEERELVRKETAAEREELNTKVGLWKAPCAHVTACCLPAGLMKYD